MIIVWLGVFVFIFNIFSYFVVVGVDVNFNVLFGRGL